MIRILFAALASLVVAAFGQVAPTPQSACQEILPEGGCSICGTGSCISDQDAIFVFSGQPAVPCSFLREAGYTGQIPLSQCPNLTPLIGVCECRAFVPTLAPSPEPPRAPIVPTPPGACPKIPPEGGCSVCGTGSCINMPDAIFVFPGQPSRSCSVLQDEGFSGQIPLNICSLLPSLTFLPGIGVCECRPFGDTLAPSPPTPSPTRFPASAPTTRAPIAPTPLGPCPEIPPEGGCSVCGTGSCITRPDPIIALPGQPEVTCGVLQDTGFSGQIPLAFCPIIPQLIGVCECRPFGPTLAPSTPTTSAPRPPGATIATIGPSFAPLCPTPGAPGPKTIAPSGYGKTPVPAPALPTSDTKGKKDGKKKMSKIRKP
jgi:hypothetical protein